MRFVMLDTETTGLSYMSGDRMVEIGCVEVSHRIIHHSRVFHSYLNPGRSIPEEVVRIHGISDTDVANSPAFPEIAQEFLDFIQGATVVIHNAAFDLGFIMHELRLAGLPDILDIPVVDTLGMSRKRYPRQRNTLDALCDRFDIDRSRRTRHGALLDAELLAEIYLAMTGGRQFSLRMEDHSRPARSYVQLPALAANRDEQAETATMMRRPKLPILEEDQVAHEAMLARIQNESGQAIWMMPQRQG